jgi:hypothetical protein
MSSLNKYYLLSIVQYIIIAILRYIVGRYIYRHNIVVTHDDVQRRDIATLPGGLWTCCRRSGGGGGNVAGARTLHFPPREKLRGDHTRTIHCGAAQRRTYGRTRTRQTTLYPHTLHCDAGYTARTRTATGRRSA